MSATARRKTATLDVLNSSCPTAQQPRPPTSLIHGRLIDALGTACARRPTSDELSRKPLDIDLAPPLPRRLRVYLYAATNPPGERSVGDYKVQLIVTGQRRGERGRFDYPSGTQVILGGYIQDFDAFVLWDAGLHDDFPYSKNVQVHATTVYEASARGMAHQTRSIRGRGTEEIVAVHSTRLVDGLEERMRLTAERLAGGR